VLRARYVPRGPRASRSYPKKALCNQAGGAGLTREKLERPGGMRTPPLIYIDVPALRPGTVGAYAFAFACAAVALALRFAIDPYVEGVQYVTFFPAVIIATLVSGVGAGFFCLVLSVGAAAFFLLPPRLSFYIADLSELLVTLLFILITIAIIIVIGGMRFAIECNRGVGQELEQLSLFCRLSCLRR
jgi:hypothetical protein